MNKKRKKNKQTNKNDKITAQGMWLSVMIFILKYLPTIKLIETNNCPYSLFVVNATTSILYSASCIQQRNKWLTFSQKLTSILV